MDGSYSRGLISPHVEQMDSGECVFVAVSLCLSMFVLARSSHVCAQTCLRNLMCACVLQ